MTISMVLFWGLVILGVVALVRYLGRPAQPGRTQQAPSATPQQILAERFARGEIDEQEYRQRLTTLQATTDSHTPRF